MRTHFNTAHKSTVNAFLKRPYDSEIPDRFIAFTWKIVPLKAFCDPHPSHLYKALKGGGSKSSNITDLL